MCILSRREEGGDFLWAEFLAHFVYSGELFGELLDGTGAGQILKCSLGFADVCDRAFDVRANDGRNARLIQAGAQGGVGQSQPRVKRVTVQVRSVGFGGGRSRSDGLVCAFATSSNPSPLAHPIVGTR